MKLKGLVHPQVNSKNRYRMYSFYQIMELLDISYYRSLGLSIGQIHQLYESGDEEQLLCLLREKKRETEKKILYEQQLLKRIEHVGSMTARIRERGGEIDITTFPEGYVLFEQREDSLAGVIWSRSPVWTIHHFVFCQMVREFAIEQQGGEERLCKVPSRMMLLLDKDTAQQLGDTTRAEKPFLPCVHCTALCGFPTHRPMWRWWTTCAGLQRSRESGWKTGCLCWKFH